MIPERRHRNRADQRERPGQRLGQRTATLASDGEHAVHTLQRTLGNQAVQELRSRGALGAAITTGPPVAGPAPESEPATATEEQLEAAAAVPGEQEAPLEAGDAEPGAGPEAEGEAGAEPAAEGAEAEADAEAEAAAETEAEEAPATEPGTGVAGEAPVAGPTSPSSPDEDPAFQAVLEQIETVATREQSHPPPEAASAQAQAAAQGPKKEVENRAAARQVGEMAEQQPNEFDREAFKRALKDKIEQVAPKSLKQADEFKDRNELPAVKRDLTGTVDKQKEQSQKPIAETTGAKPDTSGIEPKPFTPLDPPSAGSPPPDVGAGRAAPKPKTEHEVAAPFRERSQQLDQQMAAEGVTEEQLAKAPEPEFDAALQTKRDAQTHAAQAPAAYRQHEQGVLSGARTAAETAAQTETLAMHDSRSQQLDTVGSLQEQTKSKDEQERAAVSAKLQEIYDRTTQRVTDRLDRLDADVNRAFDDGAEAARQQFEDHVAERMRQYKEARYSGVRGKIRWATDKLKITTLPKRVERYYVEGRDIYLEAMDTVIDGIATIVQTGLGEAQSIIAEGLTEVNKYLSSLPESLKAVGQQAASDIQTRFDALEQTVEARKEQLINSLAQKYTEKLQAVDARIEELKAQNRSLFERAWDAVGGVIKTIIELKNMLLGVLRKAASAASTIIQAPIEFLGNLVDGVKLGFQNFVANIWTHLQRGLISWLTGTMAEAGIQLPETFDLEGIFSLVMQLLGLTYENIRAQAVKVLGEEAVSALEKGFEMFKILVTEGVAGLWAFVKEKIGDLKAMVLDKIKELVITSVIEAGIKWILGLLSPVGAFIKACKAIYDIVTFFFERAREILTLVDAIMDSILAIAQGNLAGAAKFVEDALAKAIPIVIGFLANLLGLGDLPEKVKGVVAAIQAPINKAIQWVLEQARAAAQRLGRALGIGTEEEAAAGAVPAPEGDIQTDALVGVSDSFKTEEGTGHRLFIEEGKGTELIIASAPLSYTQFVNDIDVGDDPAKATAKTEALRIVREFYQIRNRPYPTGIDDAEKRRLLEEKRSQLNEKLEELWVQTDIIFGDRGDIPTGESEAEAIPIVWYKPIGDPNLYPPLELPDNEGRTETVHFNEKHEVDHPQMPGLSITIGVDTAKYAVREGDVLYRVPNRRGQKTSEFRYVLSLLGVDLTGLQADHVLDLNFGGDDDFANIWMFDQSANQSAGARHNSQVVTYLDTATGQVRTVAAGDRTLVGKYFVIQNVTI